MPVIRVVALDDHPLYLEGVRTALSREPDLQVVASVQDGEGWIPLLRKFNPDIALLDLNMPKFNAPEAIRRGAALFPKIRFVVLTGIRDESIVRQVAFAGAAGFLLKESLLKDELPGQLRRIHEGALIFDPEIVHALIQVNALTLTSQEQACLSLMAQGLTNQGIADALGLSRKRVANVLSGLYGKLDIDGLNESRWVTRVVAVREALDRGLIGVSEGRRPDYR